VELLPDSFPPSKNDADTTENAMTRKLAKSQPRSSESTRRKAIGEGRALRKEVSRASHAVWKAPLDRADPMTVLVATSRNRLAHLLPLRYGRMSRTPFTYMRGAAAMMAADLARTPATGIRVQACGDCHLGNFGAFASPERRILFDINDFDETLPAPWEYDLKRLATSFTLVARNQGCDEVTAREATMKMARAYREHLHEFAYMSPLEVWYAIIDSEILIGTAPNEATRRRRVMFEQKARMRTADSLLGRLLVEQGGQWKFRDQPPTIARLRRNTKLEISFRKALERYPATLPDDRRILLSHYRLVDVAFKVVGVGNVGTRCAIALYLSTGGDRLVLQVKEACPSVLAPYAGKSTFAHQGHRVVVGQRLMQCASDIFLGWAGDDEGHEYYVRQLRDMKTSVPLEELRGPVLFNFADMCGWALARAHAKAGDAARLSGYVGSSARLDEAIADFARAYADQCEKDHAVFLKAIRAGRIPVEMEQGA
jgi:uncharacterized protein (DUF2252 family)